MNINGNIICLSLMFAFVCFTVINATVVNQCNDERQVEYTDVNISNCTKGVCRLRRKSIVHIDLKFTPEENIKKLTTTVFANVLGIPLPFIGVDSTSACDNIYTADGSEKLQCPLKAGETYLYKNQFEVLQIYPKINLVVHWALTRNNKNVVCFEVPAKII